MHTYIDLYIRTLARAVSLSLSLSLSLTHTHAHTWHGSRPISGQPLDRRRLEHTGIVSPCTHLFLYSWLQQCSKLSLDYKVIIFVLVWFYSHHWWFNRSTHYLSQMCTPIIPRWSSVLILRARLPVPVYYLYVYREREREVYICMYTHTHTRTHTHTHTRTSLMLICNTLMLTDSHLCIIIAYIYMSVYMYMYVYMCIYTWHRTMWCSNEWPAPA
jgi:hypothetical protein